MVRKILQNFRRIDKNKRISGDFRNSKCQAFPEKHAWAPLDKLAPSILVELALRASFPHQSKIFSASVLTLTFKLKPPQQTLYL